MASIGNDLKSKVIPVLSPRLMPAGYLPTSGACAVVLPGGDIVELASGGGARETARSDPSRSISDTFQLGSVEGDSKVKALLGLPMIATAMPSSAVHLLEDVGIGVPVELPIKGILQMKTLDLFGSGDVAILSAYLS
uniref:Uncharacterized protein n=1 Tax=Oryza barthii TaxID=65489 RepID=A0A0D3FUP1_9ORYZ